MERRPTKFPEVFVIVPEVFRDERGLFQETYSQSRYAQAGVTDSFVQDNLSVSHKGVLRGMHYDLRMVKLVQCLAGSVYDVVVDVREDSATYRQWDAVELRGDNHWQIYVPAGFAHGFYVRSDRAVVLYKQSALYDPAYERGLSWRDSRIGIEWPLDGGDPVLSAKDAAL